MKKLAVLAVLAMAMMMVFGVVASAQAATGTVVISAQVNSKLTMTVPADNSFGAFAPDAANPAPYSGNVNVRSNVTYTLVRTMPANTFPASMLSVNTPAGMNDAAVNPKAPSAAGFSFAQTYTLDLRPGGVWQDPGTYSASYLYTSTP